MAGALPSRVGPVRSAAAVRILTAGGRRARSCSEHAGCHAARALALACRPGLRGPAARARYRVELDERNVDGVLAVFFIDGGATAVAHLEALVAWLDGAGRRPEPPPARDGLG